MNRKRKVSALLLLASLGASAAVMVSAGYLIQRVWVGGGGSRATSASFGNTMSMGQGVAGAVISGGGYRLRGGFIQPFAVTTSTNTNCNITDPSLETVCLITGPSGLITVTFPGGSVTQATTIGLSIPVSFPVGSSNLAEYVPLARGVTVTLSPTVTLRNAFRIDFTYMDVDAPSADERRLRLGVYDASRTQWTPLVGPQDTGGNVLTVFPRGTGTFQLLELSPATDIENPIVAPNPFRPSLGHTRMAFSRLPEGASVDIFTLSGERIRGMNSDAGGQAIWDVTNDNGEKVVSGSYLVVIRQGSNNKVITIAVER